MLVSPHLADGDARESGASRPNQDIVLRAALRSALESVRSVCDELFAQLASARCESIAEAAAASERIAGIQAEAELAVQRARLEVAVRSMGTNRVFWTVPAAAELDTEHGEPARLVCE